MNAKYNIHLLDIVMSITICIIHIIYDLQCMPYKWQNGFLSAFLPKQR